MNDTYNPATISAEELSAIIERVDRYLARHGAPSGETPIRDDQRDDVRQSILAAWWGDDWDSRDWESLTRHGRTLFPPTLSGMGRHLRAVLFHAGRARRRGWRSEGATRRVADRRREPEEFTGAGSASRASDPARILSAVESATGELVLSPAAQRYRSRTGLPLKYRGGVAFTPADAPRPFRVMRRRGRKVYTVDVVGRYETYTAIDIREAREYRFERVGSVPHRIEANSHYRPTLGIGRVVRSKPNPATAKSRKALPRGVTAGECRDIVG
jgi:hypothetical protein